MPPSRLPPATSSLSPTSLPHTAHNKPPDHTRSLLAAGFPRQVLERLDPDPDYWDGKRGACVGVFQLIIAEQEPRESLREVISMLRASANSQVRQRVSLRHTHAPLPPPMHSAATHSRMRTHACRCTHEHGHVLNSVRDNPFAISQFHELLPNQAIGALSTRLTLPHPNTHTCTPVHLHIHMHMHTRNALWYQVDYIVSIMVKWAQKNRVPYE